MRDGKKFADTSAVDITVHVVVDDVCVRYIGPIYEQSRKVKHLKILIHPSFVDFFKVQHEVVERVENDFATRRDFQNDDNSISKCLSNRFFNSIQSNKTC